jgi:beta-lactamase superfamily II metal-dependent hydrolase
MLKKAILFGGKKMLDIKIFDIDHGFCAAVSTGDNHTILIDFGYSVLSGFNPSKHLLQQQLTSLDCLIVPAYGEEHLAGLSDFLKQTLIDGLAIHYLVANPSLAAEQFHELDVANQRFSNVLTTELNSRYPKINRTMKIHGIDFSFFWNNYPDFKDAHNLSMVTFVSYRDIKIVFPSDLEKDGWRQLLKNDDFCNCLRHVNIFVAANHGREESYCPEVFDYCRPEIIIISNELNQRISPDMLNKYWKHAKGCSESVCDRKLLTTYDDGTITISKYLDRLGQVQTQRKAY